MSNLPVEIEAALIIAASNITAVNMAKTPANPQNTPTMQFQFFLQQLKLLYRKEDAPQ